MSRHYSPTLIILFQIFLISSSRRLSFNNNGTFTILQLTDLHLGEADDLDANTMRLQAELINRVQPDIVVASGDILSGYAYRGQPNFFRNVWTNFTKAFIDSQTYYAFVMGNHDAENQTPEDVFALEQMTSYSLLVESQDVSYQTFSYYLPIYSSLRDNTMSAMTWIFNSHSTGCQNNNNSWGCVDSGQISWYHNQSEIIRNTYGDNIHHLGFVHIPLPEYLDLYNNYEFYGSRNEDLCCPIVNTGLFKEISDERNIQAMFCGHDHTNDFGGWINNIELAYGRKTGYGAYGPLPKLRRGGRVIKLTERLQADGTIEVDRIHYVAEENSAGENGPYNQTNFSRREGAVQATCAPLTNAGGFGQNLYGQNAYLGIILSILNLFFLYFL